LAADVSESCLFVSLQALTSYLQTYLRGFRLRIERKEYTMRRNMRLGIISRSPRQLEPILVHLYNQALQMGLPQEISVRILSLNRQEPHVSSAYGNTNYGSPATGDAPSGPFPPHNSASFSAPYGNVGNHQFATPMHGNFGYQQLATPQPETMDYSQQFAGPQGSQQYGQYSSMQPIPTFPPQIMPPVAQHTMNDGTTYYPDPSQPPQATAQYGSVPMQPMFGPGYGYNFQHQPYQPMNPIQEADENEHRFSHEMFGPERYTGEAYAPETYTRRTDHGHGHGN
jgi:hypothetical protein